MSRSIPSSFGRAASRTSMTYLKASGNASGRVNLPIPVNAAPATSPRCGLTNDRNLRTGEREALTSFEFIKLNLPATSVLIPGFDSFNHEAMAMPFSLVTLSNEILTLILLSRNPEEHENVEP